MHGQNHIKLVFFVSVCVTVISAALSPFMQLIYETTRTERKALWIRYHIPS